MTGIREATDDLADRMSAVHWKRGARARLVFVNRVYAPDASATSRLLSDLVSELAAQHEVLVVCSRTDRDRPADSTAGVTCLRVPWGRAKPVGLVTRLAKDAFFLACAAILLLFRLRDNDVIIAKSDPPMLHWVMAVVARLRGCRHIGWHQDLYPEVAEHLRVIRSSALSSRLLHRMRDWAVADAACNIAIGEAMGAKLSPLGKVEVIPNWALNEDVASAQDVAASRQRWCLGDRFVIAHSGNLGRVHPIKPLINVLNHYANDDQVHCLISGGGVHYRDLRRACPPVATRTYLPFQAESQLPALLGVADLQLVVLEKNIDALVVPSKLMGILAAQQCCVFVGDVDCALARVLTESAAGFAVDSDDGDALIRLIDKLRHDGALRARTGAMARNLYDSRFSRAKAISSWRQVLTLASSERLQA